MSNNNFGVLQLRVGILDEVDTVREVRRFSCDIQLQSEVVNSRNLSYWSGSRIEAVVDVSWEWHIKVRSSVNLL